MSFLEKCIQLISKEIGFISFDVDSVKFKQLKKQSDLGLFYKDYDESLKKLTDMDWVRVVSNDFTYYVTFPDMLSHKVVLNTKTVSSLNNEINNIINKRKKNECCFIKNISITSSSASFIKQISYAIVKEDQQIISYW